MKVKIEKTPTFYRMDIDTTNCRREVWFLDEAELREFKDIINDIIR